MKGFCPDGVVPIVPSRQFVHVVDVFCEPLVVRYLLCKE